MSEDSVDLEHGLRKYNQFTDQERLARREARKSDTWQVVEAIYGEMPGLPSPHTGDSPFVRLVDNSKGVLDISPFMRETRVNVSCYFYNPGRGEETLAVMSDVLQGLADGLHQSVTHMAAPTSQRAAYLLERLGYEQLETEGPMILRSEYQPGGQSPIDPSLVRKVQEILASTST